MAILDYQPRIWRESLGLPNGQEPSILVLEGTWWRKTATENRLSMLSNVRELAFPDMFLGQWNGHSIAYCCAYGAARAVEPAHIFAQLGTPLLIQIGTCGSLDSKITTGMVVLPESCAAQDGISHLYGAKPIVQTSTNWLSKADLHLQQQGVQTIRARHLTWPSLFAQSDEMCQQWTNEGLQSVDMETSTVVSVADYFGSSAISMLSVWDALAHGRTFMDPLPDKDAARLKRSNELVFEAALKLTDSIA